MTAPGPASTADVLRLVQKACLEERIQQLCREQGYTYRRGIYSILVVIWLIMYQRLNSKRSSSSAVQWLVRHAENLYGGNACRRVRMDNISGNNGAFNWLRTIVFNGPPDIHEQDPNRLFQKRLNLFRIHNAFLNVVADLMLSLSCERGRVSSTDVGSTTRAAGAVNGGSRAMKVAPHGGRSAEVPSSRMPAKVVLKNSIAGGSDVLLFSSHSRSCSASMSVIVPSSAIESRRVANSAAMPVRVALPRKAKCERDVSLRMFSSLVFYSTAGTWWRRRPLRGQTRRPNRHHSLVGLEFVAGGLVCGRVPRDALLAERRVGVEGDLDDPSIATPFPMAAWVIYPVPVTGV